VDFDDRVTDLIADGYDLPFAADILSIRRWFRARSAS
jgi:hypothetical protein